ncbi:ACT domain-containing protein [Demequina oxidasica]|uniref:ACT domain-containing protein n=1 Tax=Demequina oxidasica TaxID=676199 RepID=UPI00078084C3|nr:ACT domain-containing protein [Demequina oxidasica]
MSGEADLRVLLASMQPRLDTAVYVWASVDSASVANEVVAAAVVTVREDEGLTLVLESSIAEAYGLKCEYPSARITLEVHSALEAVGLTAAFAAALGDVGISANVVAGYHHDHIFVPCERADDAMMALRQLSAASALRARNP